MGTTNLNCKECGAAFLGRSLQKYCSDSCKKKQWQKNNLHRYKQYNKNYRAKQILLCRLCQEPIPMTRRRSGVVFCSDSCCETAKKNREYGYRQEAQELFEEYKKNIGCKKCGYKICGSALDYHHIDPSEKERRIDAKSWIAKSATIQDEVGKCVLLCKNCHAEFHELMRKNMEVYREEIKKIIENGDIWAEGKLLVGDTPSTQN